MDGIIPAKLPDNFKSLVIQGWLKGIQRDKIAGDNGLSARAVTNIVDKELGLYGIHSDDDLLKFAKVVHGISQEGYDAGKVIKEFSDLKSLKTEYWSYQESIPDLKKEI